MSDTETLKNSSNVVRWVNSETGEVLEKHFAVVEKEDYLDHSEDFLYEETPLDLALWQVTVMVTMCEMSPSVAKRVAGRMETADFMHDEVEGDPITVLLPAGDDDAVLRAALGFVPAMVKLIGDAKAAGNTVRFVASPAT